MELFVGSLSRGQVGAIAAAVARSSYCGISRALNAARLAGSPAEHGSCGHGRHMVTSARKLLPAAGLARPAVVPSPREAWILLGGGVMSRSMGSAPGGGGDVKVYQSSAETAMKSLAIASLAQFGICVMMGCLIVWHPAAATSALLPGWTTEGRMVLGGIVSVFGGTFASGTRGFMSKQIMRIATIPGDDKNVHVYTLEFPTTLKCHLVPRKEFYSITAAYTEIDLDKDAKESQIMPIYVGGSLRQTLIMDLKGEISDKAVVHELLTKAAVELAGEANWDKPAAQGDAGDKKTFVPNRVRNKL